MNQLQIPPPSGEKWRWPLEVSKYDRSTALSPAELALLNSWLGSHRNIQQLKLKKVVRVGLARLIQPLGDVADCLGTTILAPRWQQTLRTLLFEMHRHKQAFWGWTEEQWLEIIGENDTQFNQQYAWGSGSHHGIRRCLVLVAYLLGVIPGANLLFEKAGLGVTLAGQAIFGKELIEAAMSRIIGVLKSWGYQQQSRQALLACLCYLFLQTRRPYLEDISLELLTRVDQTCPQKSVGWALFQVSRALCALGIIAQTLPAARGGMVAWSGSDGSISPEWFNWCQRRRKHTTLLRPDGRYYILLKIGRWLKRCHCEVNSPADFTYELAAEFVTAVNQMKVGEWADQHNLARIPQEHLGRPLRPNSKRMQLSTLRIFLHDCQECHWIEVRLNPDRALRTPRSIRNQLGPDPRVVDSAMWAKILWAAMHLEFKDLPFTAGDLPAYPLELIRALAAVWCFAALRSDEIVRLRVGCVRRQREDVTITETKEVLPKEAVCLLDVPVNKTSAAYTKAVHPFVAKAIEEWEQVRPQEQLRSLDKKTSEVVNFLFVNRGKLISRGYINQSLIPTLCKKAGIPTEDSRGRITNHRARATIASMLYNAKEPLTLFELKEYLGHKDISSTQYYARVDPTKLASKVAKSGYLEKNMATIEVLLDQEAVISGAAARGEVWKYYDLGHGWCTNPFWADCAHRMACARCPYYRPKDSLKEQLTEGKANLVHMLEYVTLSEDEQLLVTEGIELHQALIDKLVDVPTPAGPTPKELGGQPEKAKRVIPLRAAQPTKRVPEQSF